MKFGGVISRGRGGTFVGLASLIPALEPSTGSGPEGVEREPGYKMSRLAMSYCSMSLRNSQAHELMAQSRGTLATALTVYAQKACCDWIGRP